jgi:histone-lysine N-methyltransferase SETD3
MPLFFKEEELAWLKGSITMLKISDRIDSLRREYDNIRKAVPEFNAFSAEDFVWARLVVITRIFGLMINNVKTDGLVPYADMLNHKRPKDGGSDTKWTYDDAYKGFTIVSLRNIGKGEQVYDSYGRKCNSRFFVNYGFALDENEDNEAMIRVELPTSDPKFATKIGMISHRDMTLQREYQIPACYREKKCKELFSFMRFVHANDQELLMLGAEKPGEPFKADNIEPITRRNEIAVLLSIKKACLMSLSGYPDSLEHDKKLLESGTLPLYSNVRNCVVMRKGEKEVLDWFVKLADTCIPYLKSNWTDMKRIFARASQMANTLDQYIFIVVMPLVKRGL